MARLNTGTRIYGSANVDGMLVVGQITPNNANVGLANTGSLQVWGGAYISGNTTIGGQSTTEQVYVQGNSNLLRFSQNLENAGWGKSTSIVRFGPSANTFAPDGTNTASQLINNTGGVDTGYVGQDVTTLNQNTPYTFSVYMKQGSCPFGQINLYAAGGGLNDASANVNFNTGTVTTSGTNLINSTFVNVGGGWYRVSITLNSLNQRTFINRLYLRSSGVAGEFGYFWGAQLEPGITPSAYANTSSGNIVKANNNLFVIGNTYIYSSNSSVSNTTGALVVGGGVGITGNLFMSAANNYVTSTSSASYRLGWTDNYFQRDAQFGGMKVQGTYFELDTTTYLGVGRNFVARGLISNDQGNNTVLFAGSSPVRLQNTATSTSNTTGALIVGGGVGVSGNVVSNSFITSADTSTYSIRLDNFGAGGGPRLEIGTPATPASFMTVGAYNNLNNIDTNNRNFRLGSTAVTNIMLANAATGQITFANNVIVSGNLTVIGNVSVENVQSFAVSDPLIQLGIGNYTSDLRDIGFAAHYNDGTNAHTGFIRDSGTKEYYLFQGYTPELSANNNIVLTDPSFRLANVYSSFFKGNVITGGSSFITIAGNTTSSPSTITSGGSDADVSMNLVSKGAGSINFIARGVPVVTMASGSSPFGTIASPFIFSPTIPGAWGSKLTLPGNDTATIQTPDGNSLRFGTFGGTGVGSYFGNTQFEITHTGSAVNYLSVTGNTTSNGPVLSAEGTSANIDINIRPKGAGSVNIQSNGASTYLNLRTPVGVAIANVTASGACTRSQIVTFAPGNGSEANLIIYTTGLAGLPPATAKISSLTGKSTLQVEGGQSASINIITLGASSTATANLQIRSGIGGSFSGDAGVLIYGKTNSLKLLHTGTGAGSRFDMGIDTPGGGADFATANITSNLVDGTSSLRVIGGNRADFKLSANGASGFTSFDVENIGTSNNIVYANVVSSFGGANVQILGQQVGSGPGSARLRIFSNATANLTIESGSTGLSPSASLRIVGAGSAPAYANIGSTTSAASQVNIISSLPSTSNTTGALVVTGGVGISGNVYADNVFSNNAILLTANNYTTYADPVGTAVALAIALG